MELTAPTAAAFLMLWLGLCGAGEARAQWTSGGGNTTTNDKVGVGTASPAAAVHARGNLSSPLTGTVSVTQNSAAVTGAGTNFTAELAAGDSLKIGAEVFTVAAVASATSLTLDSNYLGATASGVTAYRDPALLAVDNGDGAGKLVITRSGRVGIGTASPASKLSVTETATLPNRGIGIAQYSADTTSALLNLTKLRGTPAAPLSVANGDSVGSIFANVYTGNYLATAGINFQVNGTVTPSAAPTDMIFRTGSTGYGNETMRLTSGGNLGLGTAAPAFRLDVQGGAVNAAGGLCIAGDCKTSWSQVGGTSSQWTTAGGNIHFNTGNVGVGTASPGVKLDVVGQARFGGAGGGVTANNASGWTQFVAMRTGAQQAAFIAAPSVAYSVGNPYWAMGLSSDGSAGWSLDTWDGASIVNRMRVLPGSGYVGIGTTNPVGKLNVVDGSHLSVYTTPGYGPSFSKDGLTVVANPDVGYSSLVVRSGHSSASDRGLLRLFRNDGISPQQEMLYVRMDGNVGFGTTTPGHRLDVQGGAVNAAGGLCIAGDCKTSWSQVGGTSSQWTTAGGNIHFNTGNVGVGTTAPLGKLMVTGGPNTALLIGDRGMSGSVGLQFLGSGYRHAAVRFDGDSLIVEDASASHVPSTWTVPSVPMHLIVRNGKVGIGKTNPTEALDVVGNITATGNIAAKYQDVAEWVPSTQRLAPGTVVVLDRGRSNHVLASTSSYDTGVAGVISAQPGVILGEGSADKLMVATTGRVRVKVDATHAPILIGDLLVTSDVAGVAMKSEPVAFGSRKMHAPGTIIGKALEPLEKGTGEILVLLSLQ